MMHEVVGPDVIGVRCAQPDARPFIQPQTALPGLLVWNLKPLTAPQSFHPLIIDLPTRVTQQGCNASIAIPTILPSQFDHVLDEPILIGATSGNMALRGTVLTKQATGPAFRNAKRVTHLIDAFAAT